MRSACFYPNPVSTCIVLKWDGQVRRVYTFYTIELKDAVSGAVFPVIFFQ